MRQFLNYCRDNNLELNALAWHENSDFQLAAIPAHVSDVRQFLTTDAFNSLRIREIQLNEVIAPTASTNPGQILGYLAELEAAGVSGAAKACWGGATFSDCSNGSLAGLIDPNRKEPRAAWLVYKAYADGVAARVATTSVDNFVVVGTAEADRPGKAQVLIGYVPNRGTTNAPRNVQLELNNLRALPAFVDGGTIQIDVFRIAASGEQPMSAPTFVSVFNESISETLVLTLDPLRSDEVFIVSFSRP